MNTDDVEAWVNKHGVVRIRADKTHKNEAVDQLLVELGNEGRAIPFLAIYPGNGDPPILFDGLITEGQVLAALEQADAGRDSVQVTQ